MKLIIQRAEDVHVLTAIEAVKTVVNAAITSPDHAYPLLTQMRFDSTPVVVVYRKTGAGNDEFTVANVYTRMTKEEEPDASE